MNDKTENLLRILATRFAYLDGGYKLDDLDTLDRVKYYTMASHALTICKEAGLKFVINPDSPYLDETTIEEIEVD